MLKKLNQNAKKKLNQNALRASAADMAAAVRGEKQQDEKNIMEDQEDWQEHP